MLSESDKQTFQAAVTMVNSGLVFLIFLAYPVGGLIAMQFLGTFHFYGPGFYAFYGWGFFP